MGSILLFITFNPLYQEQFHIYRCTQIFVLSVGFSYVLFEEILINVQKQRITFMMSDISMRRNFMGFAFCFKS